jgi:hypothetical protein
VLGVLLVAGCALGAVLWQRSVDDSTTVVVAVRPIERGAAIVADDLGGVRMSGDTSALVDGSSAEVLLGQYAAVDIASGVPFTAALVTGDRPLAVDEALTPIALAAGEVPPDLAAADAVRVVVTNIDGDRTETTMLDERASVWAVDRAVDDVTTVVTVRGSVALAVALSGAASVRLVRVGG